jgi:hypothetical protein
VSIQNDKLSLDTFVPIADADKPTFTKQLIARARQAAGFAGFAFGTNQARSKLNALG